MRVEKPDWANCIIDTCLLRLQNEDVPSHIADYFYAKVLPSGEVRPDYDFSALEAQWFKENPLYACSTLFEVRMSHKNVALCELIAVCRRYLRFLNTGSPKEFILRGEMNKRESLLLYHGPVLQQAYYVTPKRNRIAGIKSGESRRQENALRDAAIRQEAAELKKTAKERDIASILAKRHDLSPKQIRTILKKSEPERC